MKLLGYVLMVVGITIARFRLSSTTTLFSCDITFRHWVSSFTCQWGAAPSFLVDGCVVPASALLGSAFETALWMRVAASGRWRASRTPPLAGKSSM